jgi:hypothetical protein
MYLIIFFSRTSEDGCKHQKVKWARIESNLPAINIDVKQNLNIGKCSDHFKGIGGWAKLVTNIGEKLLNLADDYQIIFNSETCGTGSNADRRGMLIITTLNPTCMAAKMLKRQREVYCKYKRITWARIESNLLPIGLDIDRRHVIGGCSKEFPRMEWARLQTNAGSAELDLNLNNEIILNAFMCGAEQRGAEVTKHKECLPPKICIPCQFRTTVLF